MLFKLPQFVKLFLLISNIVFQKKALQVHPDKNPTNRVSYPCFETSFFWKMGIVLCNLQFIISIFFLTRSFRRKQQKSFRSWRTSTVFCLIHQRESFTTNLVRHLKHWLGSMKHLPSTRRWWSTSTRWSASRRTTSPIFSSSWSNIERTKLFLRMRTLICRACSRSSTVTLLSTYT